MSKIHKGIKIIIEVAVLIFLIALQVSIIAVSSVDLEKYRPNIVGSLEDTLGGDVYLGEMEISLFPYIGVRAHDLLADGDGKIQHIKANEVVFGIYLTRLLRGDVVPKRVKIVSPEVILKIEGDETFGGDMFSSLGRSTPEEEDRVGMREVSITNASIEVEDTRFSKEKRYEFTVFYAWFRKNRERGPIRFSVSMAPPAESGTGRIRAVGKYLDDGDIIAKVWIKGVDLATANPIFFYEKNFAIGGILSGKVDLYFKDTQNWELLGDLSGDDIGIMGLSYYPEGLNLDRIAISGSLNLTPEKLDIEDLIISKGSLDAEVDLTLKRKKEGDDDRVSMDLESNFSGFDIEDDISLVPFGLIPEKKGRDLKALLLAGKVEGSIRVKGDPLEIGGEGSVFEINSTLKNADIDLGLVIARGLSADISLSGNEILIENVTFKSPPGNVSELRWRVEDFSTDRYMRDFVVKVDKIGFEDVKNILASDSVRALPFLAPTEGVGEVRGWMNIDTPMGDTSGAPELLGEVELFDWSISVPFINATFEPTDASLVFEDEGMRISPVELRFPNSLISARGNLLNYGKPLLIMSVDAPYMDLVELFGEGDNVLMLEDFSSRLIFEEGYVLLDNIEFSLYDGKCSGDWGYVYTEDRGEGSEGVGMEGEEGGGEDGESLFFMNVEGEGVDMGALFSDVGFSEEFRGDAKFELSLKSDPGDFEAAIDTMDGNAKVMVTNGAFKKFNVLSKVISMMNISNYLQLKFPKLDTEGIPFESIIGDFEIKDGKATTENLFVNSGVIRISVVGSVDLTNGDMDMILGFQILKTIDLIVNKIPVVGYVLTGDDASLFTTYFKVGGTTDDPVVTTMTLQALGEGTINIFERIYNFPLRGLLPR